MKRCAILLILLALLLCACSKTPIEPSVPPAPSLPQENTPSTQAPPAENPPSDDPAPAPIPPEPTILDARQALDETGLLFYLPNERVEQGVQQKLLPFGSDLLLFGTGRNTNSSFYTILTVLSMQTGEILHEVKLDHLEHPAVQVCGEQIAVTDWNDGEVLLFDHTLQPLLTYETQTASCAIYLNSDASKAYAFSQKGGVQIHDLQRGSVDLLLENAVNLFPTGHCGSNITISYVDRDTQRSSRAILDLDPGVLSEIPFPGVFSSAEASDGIYLTGVESEQRCYYLGRSNRPKTFTLQQPYSFAELLHDPTRLLVRIHSLEGGSTFVLYDPDGNFLSKCQIPVESGELSYAPIWSQENGGYFFLTTNPEGHDLLHFWDLSTPVSGESLQLAPVEQPLPPESSVSSTLTAKAASLEETYGVSIRIAEQCGTEFQDYTAALEMDESYITDALDALEAVFRAYPTGFFQQLLYGTQTTIEFQLVGPLTKTNIPEGEISGFTSFSAFVQTLSSKTLVVADITRPGSLAQTLHHEIVHLIDNRLTFDAGVREDALYSEEGWAALNPEGFTYADTYHELPFDIYTDGFDSYFVDIYSRTFAREDRARILEYAMIGSDWTFSASPGRLAKLEYLCRCIRDALGSSDWPEETVWEATLRRCR